MDITIDHVKSISLHPINNASGLSDKFFRLLEITDNSGKVYSVYLFGEDAENITPIEEGMEDWK
jgi:hypothetical protein